MEMGVSWSAKAYGIKDSPSLPPAQWREEGQEEALDQFFSQDHRWCFGLRLSQYPGMLFQNKLPWWEGRYVWL